jgi:fatty-acyl-CoA synthase
LHFATVWESLADEIGDHPAYSQGTVRRTWAEFDDRAARIAGSMAALGVGAGSAVGLLLHNSTEFIESYAAALKLRAVPFNINHRAPGSRPVVCGRPGSSTC